MLTYYEVTFMGMKLMVDGKEIPLNEFVEKILSGSTVGAVTSLRGIKEGWKKIEIEIVK
jgi:hypothetical protein